MSTSSFDSSIFFNNNNRFQFGQYTNGYNQYGVNFGDDKSWIASGIMALPRIICGGTNFFGGLKGGGVDLTEDTTNHEERTNLMNKFNTAYTNYKANPGEDTKNALKEAYEADGVSDLPSYSSITKLYESAMKTNQA